MAAKAKGNGYRARALPAAVRAMKRSKRPWTRAEIDSKVKVPGGLGRRTLSGMINDAQHAGRVGGWLCLHAARARPVRRRAGQELGDEIGKPGARPRGW